MGVRSFAVFFLFFFWDFVGEWMNGGMGRKSCLFDFCLFGVVSLWGVGGKGGGRRGLADQMSD